uniref:Putative calcium activated chlorine channel n=1 Tax=Rhipicephalus microplus TaxID=6941 RepID=A0A6M2CHG6_RHIMP
MAGVLSIATALVCLLSHASPLEIDTSDGGYKDIWVSISEDVPYNESIVENIKDLFRSSSEFLHKATNGRVYFKHVTIEVPKTWPKRATARALSSGFFEKSDIRVDQPSAPHGDKPFTMQKRRCGEPGDFIQVTPGFLAAVGSSTVKTLVNPAYVMVHEWAHYRYGVFDEYGSKDDSRFPLTYCHGDKVKLNACSSRITFTARKTNGGNCTKIDTKCRFIDGCEVTPIQPTQHPVESSIMFMPYLANVSQFCDDNDGPNFHNPFAPNKQNHLCKQQSTWKVISSNADFQELPSPDLSKSIRVTFEEAQQTEDLAPRVVLVLDVSGSMNDNRRLEFLQESATRYIGDIKDGSRRLAIVTFSYDSRVVHTLMPVNVNTRDGFLNAINKLRAYGATCIGCGLESALKVLTTASETPEGAMIVLMSDGEENQHPPIAEVLEEVIASKVVVNTLALGATADNSLEKLATSTRGKAFAFRDLNNLVEKLESAFVSSTTTQHDPVSRAHTLMESEEEFTKVFEKKFHVDADVGNATVVRVTQNIPRTGTIEARLTDPSGQPCQQCKSTPNGNEVLISLPSPAKVGTWTLHVESSSSRNVEISISVKSQASKTNDEPIRVSCEMSGLLVDRPDGAVIYAVVTKGTKVVLDAVVFATVYRPKKLNESHTVTIPLYDNGQDPDIKANDGTYSGYFVQFTGKGRYAVTAHVSQQKTTRLAEPPSGSGSFFSTALFSASTAPTMMTAEGTTAALELQSEYPISDFEMVDSTGQATNATGEEAVDPFERVASGGSFQVTTDLEQKQVPPGDIRDLTVIEVRPGVNNSMVVELTWTWPGAHLTLGNASGVDIRASRKFGELSSAFDKQTNVTDADVVQGNLDPLPPGSKHTVAVYLPRILFTLRSDGASVWSGYLAARVANADGLYSKTSNIVQVFHVSPPVTTTVATTTVATTRTKVTTTVATTTTASTTHKATTTTVPPLTDVTRTRTGVSTWVWILIGCVVAAALVVPLIALAVKMNPSKRKIYRLFVRKPRQRLQDSA